MRGGLGNRNDIPNPKAVAMTYFPLIIVCVFLAKKKENPVLGLSFCQVI
jgi:hypothetical protein